MTNPLSDYHSEQDRQADEKAAAQKGLGDPPAYGASTEDIRVFLGRGYGLPKGYRVSRVVRLGGRQGTGVDVYISPPGDGADLCIHYQRETDCQNYVKLRGQAAADTKGLTRGSLLTGPKAAAAMYEAMCTLSDHFDAADETAQTWEWMGQLRLMAATTGGEIDSYAALLRLQKHPYSKRLVLDAKRGDRPVPLLLIDSAQREYITAGHMAVFLNHDLGVEGAGSDDRILSRLRAIGGERKEVREWDSTTRARKHDIHLVLYLLPEEPADE